VDDVQGWTEKQRVNLCSDSRSAVQASAKPCATVGGL
jgi:hypothetical protein